MTFKNGLHFNSADNRQDEEVLSWELVSQRYGKMNLIEPCSTAFCFASSHYQSPKPVALLAAGKGAGSFHIHRKTMKELGALAVLGVWEQPNLAQNLVTHRH